MPVRPSSGSGSRREDRAWPERGKILTDPALSLVTGGDCVSAMDRFRKRPEGTRMRCDGQGAVKGHWCVRPRSRLNAPLRWGTHSNPIEIRFFDESR